MFDFDAAAASSSQRYVDLLNVFRNILWSTLRQDPTDMRTRDALRQNATNRARVYLEAERAWFANQIEDVAQEARTRVAVDLGITPSKETENAFLSAYIDDLSMFMDAEITSQLQRDIAALSRRLEEFGLEVYMERQRGNSPSEAHIKVLISANEGMSFYFRDRAGRKLNSQKFIRTVVRHALLTCWTQIYAAEAAEYGASYLTVEHPDSTKYVDMKVGLSRDQGLPLISDIKDDIFHPQSKAYLKAHI